MFGSLGLLVAFTLRDTRARANPWYDGRDSVITAGRVAVLVVGLVVAGVHAWYFADWFSRLAVFAS